jgi:hypothetical protein
LEGFQIFNTRSRHVDTDTVTFGLQIGSHLFQLQSLFLGDLNNGDYAVNLLFGSVLISDAAVPVAFTYQIYNGDTSKLSIDLESIGKDLLTQVISATLKLTGVDTGYPNLSSGQAGVDVPTDPRLTGGGPDFEDTSQWSGIFLEALAADIASFVSPDCDGFVAADGIGMTKVQWDKLIDAKRWFEDLPRVGLGTRSATFRQTMNYPGTDSPAGCDSNSQYSVTWSVTRERISGSMRKFFNERGITLRPGVRSLLSAALLH